MQDGIYFCKSSFGEDHQLWDFDDISLRDILTLKLYHKMLRCFKAMGHIWRKWILDWGKASLSHRNTENMSD